MKKKALAPYLDLMKFAQDKNDWVKEKKYGEITLKHLSSLTYTDFDKYFLYCSLGYAYGRLTRYSQSLEMYYTANLIATKHHFSPERIAYTVYMMGRNFLFMRRNNQAISQFLKVEEYYQKYGAGVVPMNKVTHFYNLIVLGFCYLDKGEMEKVENIILNKLPSYQHIINDFSEYYHLKGEYFIAKKEFPQARLDLQEYLQMVEKLKFYDSVFESKIRLAVIDLLERHLDTAVNSLESLFRDSQYSKFNNLFCKAGLILSKCYNLKRMPNKAESIEKRIKPILNKLDIVWLYETTRNIEKLYSQLQLIYKVVQPGTNAIPEVLSRTINQHYETSGYKHVIVGQSASMQEIYQLIEKVALTDLPILIQGETGTGKELVARTVHRQSLRKGNQFLAINCAAMPETLLENELFGHTRGAFTGANKDRRGYIELASGGTLFLDEIADMSPGMQQKLLRVLEEKLLWRVGAQKPISVNTRFVFASNQNIEKLVKEKHLREDLLYRINTIVITLPPLRDRKDDIQLLANHFFEKYSTQRPSSLVSRLSSEALALLMTYNWPGNVRELENEIKRIYTLYPRLTDGQANNKEITEIMLSEPIRNYGAKTLAHTEKDLSLNALRDAYEKKLIIESLKKSNGNITKASQMLHYPRRDLYRKIQRLNIPLR